MSATRQHPPGPYLNDQSEYGAYLGGGLSAGKSSEGTDRPELTCPLRLAAPRAAAPAGTNEALVNDQTEPLPDNQGRCQCHAEMGVHHERQTAGSSDQYSHSLVGANVDAAFVDNVAVDFVVFRLCCGRLEVLCHQRPQTECLSLPCGLLHKKIRLHESARHHLEHFTASDQVYHEQIKTIDDRNLDAGSGVLRVVYYALLNPEQSEVAISTSQCDPTWLSLESAMLSKLDHTGALNLSLQSLRNSVRTRPTIFHLLPHKFTLSSLQEAYEVILGVQLRQSSFRRKVAKITFIARCQERQKDVAHRAAELYRFDAVLYMRSSKNGFNFFL